MKEWKTNQSQIKVHTVIQKQQCVCLCAADAVTANHAELYFGGLVPLKHIKTCLSGRKLLTSDLQLTWRQLLADKPSLNESHGCFGWKTKHAAQWFFAHYGAEKQKFGTLVRNQRHGSQEGTHLALSSSKQDGSGCMWRPRQCFNWSWRGQQRSAQWNKHYLDFVRKCCCWNANVLSDHGLTLPSTVGVTHWLYMKMDRHSEPAASTSLRSSRMLEPQNCLFNSPLPLVVSQSSFFF